MKYLVILALVLSGCGFNGTQKLETNDSKQEIEMSGESYSYVIVRLEFIKQIEDLCKQKYLKSEFASIELYNQAVANCVFDELKVINIDPTKISDFNHKYCQPGADLSEYTPKQQEDILLACASINPGS